MRRKIQRSLPGRSVVAGAVVLTMLVMEGAGWSQCAMCRTALENSPEGQAVAEGFQYGILFLLAAPYAVLGGVGFGLFKAFRKKSRPIPRPRQ
jgi:hypothetical protein